MVVTLLRFAWLPCLAALAMNVIVLGPGVVGDGSAHSVVQTSIPDALSRYLHAYSVVSHAIQVLYFIPVSEERRFLSYVPSQVSWY